ncbi:hypothetical protein [Varunaivibrio sulfuroxidans]|uniref:HTH cro/C1-type domain-containing protein n=1 Tax=Varunaivibrio sulfuroxidans TaxID=1773489 RepID=A0A4R3JES8_9PROT|nr:hypothetical protein [Varunaivibrio sulfuroxidans]TCS63626.1 hypothetical protein EDD55_103249 [Varunaivibrio sulfuroxidans]WES30233.1 hypothetical protein P3M64_11395 [Varunaivibrio sulfuroxidans]
MASHPSDIPKSPPTPRLVKTAPSRASSSSNAIKTHIAPPDHDSAREAADTAVLRDALLDSGVRKRIAQRRAALKFSCPELDRIGGLPAGTVDAVENAQIGISPGLLARLALALNVDPGYFFEDPQIDLPADEHEEIGELLEAFLSIDDNARHEILEMIQLLAED